MKFLSLFFLSFIVFFVPLIKGHALTPSEEKLAKRVYNLTKTGISYSIKFQLRGYNENIRSRVLNHKIKGETALIYAARGGHKNTARALLERGADPNIEDNIRHFYYPPTLHKIAYTENYIDEMLKTVKKTNKTFLINIWLFNNFIR